MVNRKKIYLLMLFAIVPIFLIGIGRVSYIKLVHGSEYEAQLISQLVNGGSDKAIMPTRGAVLDCNQQPLALSSTVYTVILDVRLMVSEHNKKTAENVSDKDRETAEFKWNNTLDTINTLLDIPMETLTSYVATDAEGKPGKDTKYFILAKKVPFDKGQQIKSLNYPWLYCEEDNQRS